MSPILKDSNYAILKYFEYEHLPPHLQAISKPFGEIAFELSIQLPYNDETLIMLRKLLEAKDCAVRSALSLPRVDNKKKSESSLASIEDRTNTAIEIMAAAMADVPDRSNVFKLTLSEAYLVLAALKNEPIP